MNFFRRAALALAGLVWLAVACSPATGALPARPTASPQGTMTVPVPAATSPSVIPTQIASPSPAPAEPSAPKNTRLSPDEAGPLVLAAIQAENPDFQPVVPLALEEVTPPQARERVGAQVFVVTGEIRTGDVFALAGGQATQLVTGFGGPGLISIHVTDLDQDGQAELAYSAGFGSGIHRSVVGVYSPAWSPPLNRVAPLAYTGGDLSLEKIDDQQVQVLRLEPAKGSGPNPAPAPFGRLRLAGDAAQPDVVIDLEPGLPPEVLEKIWQ